MVSAELPLYIFVYGTLRRGGTNDINRLSPPPRFKGAAQVAGRLLSLGDYPGIQLEEGGMVVVEVDAIALGLEAMLDEMEGIAPTPDGQCEKAAIQVAVELQKNFLA